MKRRNFLALLPALSASPFMAKEIIQSSDKVEIIRPEPIKLLPKADYSKVNIDEFLSDCCEIYVVHKGRSIGQGYLTGISIEAGSVDITSWDTPGVRGGYREYMPGPISCRIEGQLNSLHLK